MLGFSVLLFWISHEYCGGDKVHDYHWAMLVFVSFSVSL